MDSAKWWTSRPTEWLRLLANEKATDSCPLPCIKGKSKEVQLQVIVHFRKHVLTCDQRNTPTKCRLWSTFDLHCIQKGSILFIFKEGTRRARKVFVVSSLFWFLKSDEVLAGGRDVLNERPREDEQALIGKPARRLGHSAVIHTTKGDIKIKLFPEE